jgi:DNA-binding NarL/FixJ family response regulator
MSIAPPQTVYIIEDHHLMAEALERQVRRINPSLRIFRAGKMGALEAAIARGGAPDVFLLDLGLPDTLGLSGLHYLRKTYPHAHVLVVTADETAEQASACLQAGASAYVLKTASPKELTEQFSRWIHASTQAQGATETVVPQKLSKRQKQLIVLLDEGASNADIAQRLGITEHTVKVHMWRLFQRLGVKSRTQALHFARTHGWL